MIKSIWDMIDGLDPIPSCCICNLTKQILKSQQDTRLLHFVMKVSQKYALVKSNYLILLKHIGCYVRRKSQESQ